MKESVHETLAIRLADILAQAYEGKVLTTQELAEKYSVSTKTIHRDFNRLSPVIEKCPDASGYRLTTTSGRLFFEKDLERLITVLGWRQALPGKSKRFLTDFLNGRNNDCYHFQQPPLEIASTSDINMLLEQAIKQRCQVTFQYKDKHRDVCPYLMVYSRGSWYLAATRDGELKAYSFSRIKFLRVTKTTFIRDDQVIDEIKNYDTIWFGSTMIDVVLEVNSEVAFFFKRKSLLPRQEILETMADGSLRVKSSVCHYKHITPLVQYWMPNVQIIEPQSLKDYVRANLERGLDRLR